MYKNFAREHSQAGQTAVLFALMIIGLVAFIGLAVDGGNAFSARRVVQNGADSAALTGVHYMASSDAPTEERLQEVVNSIVEDNGVDDTDGVSGNATNDNVTIYYTNASGGRLTTEPCWEVPCGSIPSNAFGLEVVVDHQTSTYFLGVINQNVVNVGANAVAVMSGTNAPGEIGNNVMVAFGACEEADKPLDFSSGYVDVIGGIHSATWFENRGEHNHYHGQVTYGEGYGWIDTAANPGVYEPKEPQPVASPGGDPLARLELTVDRFHCSTGDIGQGVTCYDMTQVVNDFYDAKFPDTPDDERIISKQVLEQMSPDGGDNFLYKTGGQGNNETWALREGLYYGGHYPFDFGKKAMTGTVTLVSSNYIKLTENDIQLAGYLPDTTIIPGLLFYSTHTPPDGYDECTQYDQLPKPEGVPINTTGNTGKTQPAVYHEDDLDKCVLDRENTSDCYELGSLQFIGLIYAPNGRVATSGAGASYVGAIIAPSIRINGALGRNDNKKYGEPDPVGALFVVDTNLFPTTARTISLER